MIQWMMLIFMLIFNFIFMNMKHPLAMGLTLLLQTTTVTLMSGLMTKSFWFSYILFLIFIGGMLVLFIYMTSLASNEMFNFSIKLLLVSMVLMTLASLLLLLDKNLIMQLKNTELKSIVNLNTYITENSLSLNKLYNYPTNLLSILLMNYLFITLIAVVKITKLFKGPLRSMFN